MKTDPNYKLRQARYLYEDFRESIDKLKVISYTCIMLAGILVLSTIMFGATSDGHALFSAISGLVILVSQRWLELEEKHMIYFLLCAYFGVLIIEYLTLGLPDPLIPGLGGYGHSKIVALVTLLNGLTPLLYFGVRLGAGYLFFRVLFYQKKVDALPAEIKGRLGLKK